MYKRQHKSVVLSSALECRLVGMADEVDSKSIDGDIVRVQVPQPALLGRGKKPQRMLITASLGVFSFLENCPADF